MFASGVHTQKIGVVETTTDVEVEDGEYLVQLMYLMIFLSRSLLLDLQAIDNMGGGQV